MAPSRTPPSSDLTADDEEGIDLTTLEKQQLSPIIESARWNLLRHYRSKGEVLNHGNSEMKLLPGDGNKKALHDFEFAWKTAGTVPKIHLVNEIDHPITICGTKLGPQDRGPSEARNNALVALDYNAEALKEAVFGLKPARNLPLWKGRFGAEKYDIQEIGTIFTVDIPIQYVQGLQDLNAKNSKADSLADGQPVDGGSKVKAG
ncbi:uncharacterized protein CC84DRAFT_1222942 [Paraphaeosphaeria sporulosa]|uniref:Uncharacterized protein n=1 Tax=Paraphaeosphaeria sporulosa TaxID=1460663 RepID=A0A177BWB0_9PLEO|nr:uncharacterized protein CC84DRAFT_1222942 [Paraphaeosphaeria sporulosa]OAF99240.1 hypothetical protein CC84DRAFT_1222942 [Paraphaeosphaeria sporulosa]